MTVVCAHQPNYLPGLSVIEKIEQADSVIWLDAVQFTHGGFTNRQRMPDGSWLTVPVDHDTTSGPINKVLISDHDPHWARRHARTLRQHYGNAETVEQICDVLERHRSLTHLAPLYLAPLNFALLALLLPQSKAWFYQSKLSPSTNSRISVQLAIMVERASGTIYLSGPSGRQYLDETCFHERGIEVRYFDRGLLANPCVLERYRREAAA